MRRVRATAIAVLASFVVAACGGDGDTDTPAADRTIEVRMVDTAFQPETLEVAAGETVRFAFRNTGKLAHDAFIGDRDAQDGHEQEMRDADGSDHGGHGGGESDAITVDTGESGELTHTFERPGTYEVGCHQPGHYSAGMKIVVEVR